jgi:hypothetical protein
MSTNAASPRAIAAIGLAKVAGTGYPRSGCLRYGYRGLPGCDSLRQLVQNLAKKPGGASKRRRASKARS